MSYSMNLSVFLASVLLAPTGSAADGPGKATPPLDDLLQDGVARLRALVDALRRQPLSPAASAQFERDLRQATRELARSLTQWTYNNLEPAAAADAPAEVQFEGYVYRRLGRRTPQTVSTLFGTIKLWRRGYRVEAGLAEPVLFPLCRLLGVVHGTTPALAERLAFYQAEAGATQRRTLERLRSVHGVVMGTKRLRQVTEAVATALEDQRLETQAAQVVTWLTQAQASRGKHRPVLTVGRDGITLALQIKKYSIHEVATTGTVSVYDRRGRRLGTVYLAATPEPGQATLSRRLTELLEEVFRRWQGSLPRLSYVTDAGDNETTYYRTVLRRLRHPRTGQRLAWTWVVDYYHASERLWHMAEALFGTSPRLRCWVRKMQKLLLKPGGVGRVLHSAAALRSRLRLRGQRLTDFRKAYRYLQTRRRHLRYAEYRRWGLPIGSGVTEAACKTVYTQRLKLSGMRWKWAGAQPILTLRTLLLSGVWAEAYERTLHSYKEVTIGVPGETKRSRARKAA